MPSNSRPVTRITGTAALAAAIALLAAGCSTEPEPQAAPSAAPTSPAASSSNSPSPSAKPSSSPSEKAVKSKRPTPVAPAVLPKLDNRNSIAFAPLKNPEDVTVVGSVATSSAWSTSKVLVVLAFIKQVAGGNPDNLSAEQRSLITRALTASDLDALIALRSSIPGGSGPAMTQILRAIGDTQTAPWPNSSEGSHQWTPRNQVRFMAALNNGRVVSPAASRYVLNAMEPIPPHRWGLGTIGASAFKGGWLTPDSETRQMGIVDGYAVAIITDGVGPAVLESDGDYAHEQQMNKLAGILKQYLKAEDSGRG